MTVTEARVAGIHAKKAAALDRVRQLLSALPPEMSAKLDQRELLGGRPQRCTRLLASLTGHGQGYSADEWKLADVFVRRADAQCT